MTPDAPSASATLRFYTRAGCGLCREARAELQRVLEERAIAGLTPCRIEERAITDDPSVERRFHDTIPVLAVGGEELPLATSARAIRAFLARTLDVNLA